ncbi:hypothetical protein CCANI_07400 [Corynebacterium canis]|nr:hypothetical protein CCANI_07400 [Corynebacterium canis]
MSILRTIIPRIVSPHRKDRKSDTLRLTYLNRAVLTV